VVPDLIRSPQPHILPVCTKSRYLYFTHRDMSPAAVMETEKSFPLIQVLFLLYPGVDALDVLGPMEVLKKALHNSCEPGKSQRREKVL
jgi:hypothetical protein